MKKTLVPTRGCKVVLLEDVQAGEPHDVPRWRVVRHYQQHGEVFLELLSAQKVSRSARMTQVCSGFLAGMSVEEVPSYHGRSSRGTGLICATRRIAGSDQCLVMFWADGSCAWVPFQLLRAQLGAESHFVRGDFREGDAEKLRLRVLARGLERWNENTGALSRLEIDPLPHQLHLVHHILRSGRLDWLIADDVGLGKTIEVGMLLAALAHRRDFERILIVTPAGLTTQWQEELREKFAMDDFLVYGSDIKISHSSSQWRLFPHMIASVDRLKHENHLDMLLQAPDWDLVIFDEAHWLSRRESGSSVSSTQRYKLAAELRSRTQNMLLLTATPHQGKEDAFRGILELIRPDWKERFDLMNVEPDFLTEMIYRNRKSDVTDQQGNFIFRGQDTRAISLELSEQERAFDAALQRYFREGYALAERGGHTGRAVGFVMTTFRKLAASSHAAILTSLERRRQKLLTSQDEALQDFISLEDAGLEGDGRFQGEHEEQELFARFELGSFFDGELDMLTELVSMATQLVASDSKLEQFLEIVGQVTRADPHRKILIFTEFRSTQAHIQAALQRAFGMESVSLIHGGLKLGQKRGVVEAFGEDLQFVVSTEAGGEGLNMHHGCHTMINYDMPWNPMRLVQRMGRLYRYGQAHRVVVFNLHSPDTIDGKIVSLLYERIEKVVKDLAPLGDEFHERMHEEIFGEIAQMADVSDILEEARSQHETRTSERIDEALERARLAHGIQQDLLTHASGFDPNALASQLKLEQHHLDSFVRGMLRQLGCPVLEEHHQQQVIRVRITDAVRARLGSKAESLRLTTYRQRSSHDTRMMDFNEPLFRYMIELAQSTGFGGYSATACAAEDGVTGFSRICWQDEVGNMVREELLATRIDAQGAVHSNDAVVSEWLAKPATDSKQDTTQAARIQCIRSIDSLAREALTLESNERLLPMLSQSLAVVSTKKSS